MCFAACAWLQGIALVPTGMLGHVSHTLYVPYYLSKVWNGLISNMCGPKDVTQRIVDPLSTWPCPLPVGTGSGHQPCSTGFLRAHTGLFASETVLRCYLFHNHDLDQKYLFDIQLELPPLEIHFLRYFKHFHWEATYKDKNWKLVEWVLRVRGTPESGPEENRSNT